MSQHEPLEILTRLDINKQAGCTNCIINASFTITDHIITTDTQVLFGDCLSKWLGTLQVFVYEGQAFFTLNCYI